jgi:hypothetical protein
MKFVLVPTAAMLSFGVAGLFPSFASFPAAVQYTSSVVSASLTYHVVANAAPAKLQTPSAAAKIRFEMSLFIVHLARGRLAPPCGHTLPLPHFPMPSRP